MSVSPSPSRPELTADQQRLLLSASAELLGATVTGRRPTYVDPTLAGAAQQLISGAYVRLKRGEHLRGEFGQLRSSPVTLGEAVADAVVRAAVEDSRFPVVSPSELEHLDMEVLLLFGRELLPLKGDARLNAVDPKKHGLSVARMGRGGLVFPGEGAKNNWDARQCLEQVCQRAGLRTRSWKDGATSFVTFEALTLTTRMADHEGGRGTAAARPFLTADELAICARSVLHNFRALLIGAVPQYTLEGVPDGTVNGIFLVLRRLGRQGTLDLPMPISFRPGMPLQATLFQQAQAAAQFTAQAGLGDWQGTMGISLVVLTDPAMHGTVASPSLAGFDPRARLLMVMEGSKFSAVYNPEQSAEEILAEASKLAQVQTPETASVYSLSAASTEPSFKMASAPQMPVGPDQTNG